jgi:hypothetical protein
VAKKPFNPQDKQTFNHASRILVDHGYFDGYRLLLAEYDISPELGANLKVGLYRLIMRKVREAKHEIARLQASIHEMEAACAAGIVPRPAQGLQPFDAAYSRLGAAARSFDGWTISLLESDISILAGVDSPETSALRVSGLQDSFSQLWNVRQAGYQMMSSHPEVFDLSIRVS